ARREPSPRRCARHRRARAVLLRALPARLDRGRGDPVRGPRGLRLARRAAGRRTAPARPRALGHAVSLLGRARDLRALAGRAPRDRLRARGARAVRVRGLGRDHGPRGGGRGDAPRRRPLDAALPTGDRRGTARLCV
ncbi:MAG: hypothetical protein AVDCRST_MAG45-1191, partial [uncultured Solirubrobacterales bacterium]